MIDERDWRDTRSTSFLLLYNSNSQLSSNSWITVRGLLQLNSDNLLLLDSNTTQLNFCSWVKTQPSRNRVACSKIKVFTRFSPQTCSLLVDKFSWHKGEAVQVRCSFQDAASNCLWYPILSCLPVLKKSTGRPTLNPSASRGKKCSFVWHFNIEILVFLVVDFGGWGLDNCT